MFFDFIVPRILRYLNVKVVVRDSNTYMKGQNYIFVNLNQESLIGSFAVSECFKPTHIPFYLCNARFAYLFPVWGWYIGYHGVIVFQHFKSSRKRALQICLDRVGAGENLYLSIEGKRSSDGSLSEYKQGAALISTMTNTPIVGIVMHGSKILQPYGSFNVNPGTITFDVLPPILNTKNYKKEELTNVLRQMAESSIKKYQLDHQE